MTWGLHVTLVSRWLDPGDTEGLITPFMVLYALHDALVKPMAEGLNTPSLAESWSVSKDGITYEFVLRKNAKFHNGDPVTADDVKFTFERYRGSGAKLLKDKVKEVQVAAANRVRFVLKEPWPDFMASYGTSATGAGWIVPKEVRREGRRGGIQEGPDRRRPYKFVDLHARGRAGAGGIPGLLAEAAVGQAPGHEVHPRGEHAGGRGQDGRGRHRLPLRRGAGEELRRTPGVKIVAPLVYGVYWLDFLDQWEPKSPWHDRRVRQAASLAIDRQALNRWRCSASGGRPAPSSLRRSTSLCPSSRPPTIPSARSSSWPRPGIRTASTEATSLRCRPTPRSGRRWPAIFRPSASRPG